MVNKEFSRFIVLLHVCRKWSSEFRILSPMFATWSPYTFWLRGRPDQYHWAPWSSIFLRVWWHLLCFGECTCADRWSLYKYVTLNRLFVSSRDVLKLRMGGVLEFITHPLRNFRRVCVTISKACAGPSVWIKFFCFFVFFLLERNVCRQWPSWQSVLHKHEVASSILTQGTFRFLFVSTKCASFKTAKSQKFRYVRPPWYWGVNKRASKTDY